jgi:hypothetical protein
MATMQLIKQRVTTTDELKSAFQKLLRGEVDLIWADDIKCSNDEYHRFNTILTQIKNMSWMFNINCKLERLGNKMFLEVKKKRGIVMNKYEAIGKVVNINSTNKLEEMYDIDDPLPNFVNISGNLYKLKEEKKEDGK